MRLLLLTLPSQLTDLWYIVKQISFVDVIDILCVSGTHLLTNSKRTRWDIPYTVKRNGTLSFTVNIRQPYQGDTMTFAMVAGSKKLYTFTVRL